MSDKYKRIVTIDADKSSAFLQEAFDPLHGSFARPGRGGRVGEYVIEVPNGKFWKAMADGLVAKYDNGK